MTLLVVGNASVDVCLTVSRFPNAGETVLAGGQVSDAGGKGLNQAVAAARAGARVVFATAIGTGPDARVIEARLAAAGLSSSAQLRWEGPSDVSVVLTDAAGENMIVSTDTMAKALRYDHVQACFEPLGADDMVLLQGNLLPQTTRECLRQARARGSFTVLNPSPIAFDYSDLLPMCDLVVSNELETNALGADTDLAAASQRILAAGCGGLLSRAGRPAHASFQPRRLTTFQPLRPKREIHRVPATLSSAYSARDC
jgi:ribokinase